MQQVDRAIVFVAIHKQRIGNLSVSFCHTQVRMSHLLLESKQIAAILKPEGSEAVSDLVGGELRARAFAVSSEVPTQYIGFHLQAITGREQPVFPLLRFHL